MKVIICSKLKETDKKYFIGGWKIPYEELENLGWKSIDYKEIAGVLSEFFINKFGQLPQVLLFWNVIPSETHNLIYNNITDILSHKWTKCISIDDLHHRELHRKGKFEKLILKNFDYIFPSYVYIFSKFFKTVSPKKLISCPHSINNKFVIAYNDNPINRILLSGCSRGTIYPFRHYVRTLSLMKNDGIEAYPIDVLEHLTYKNPTHKYYGYEYITYLNKYIACVTCSAISKLPYIVAKFFEIPASGSLLLADDTHVKKVLEGLGFVDGENYMSANSNNIKEKILFVTNPVNRKLIDKIRKNGYDFVWNNHTLMHRVKIINELC